LRTLAAVTETVNANLEKASVRIRYTQVPDAPADATLEAAVGLYEKVAFRIDRETRNLFEAYKAAFEAFNQLVDQHGVTIPVSPDTLLGSHEYVTAMRLVAEEYWLNFHLRYSEELETKKNSLLEQLGKISPFLSSQQASQLRGVMDSIGASAPADSVAILGRVDEARAIFGAQVKVLEDSPLVIKKAIESVDPKASSVIPFQTPKKLNEVASLRKEFDSARDGLDTLTRFLVADGPAFQALVTTWRSDREGLELLAQYPTARRVIERVLVDQGKVKVKTLPYGKTTAVIYAQLYASENPKASFQQKEGVLSLVA